MLVASLSLAIAMSGLTFDGTFAMTRFGAAGFRGMLAKCFRICASISAGSKSPTATTAMRSGRYQSL